MEILGKGERLNGCAFIPRVGERVEFRSDRQTEKGPSGGMITQVNRDDRTATIRHSDHPGETFSWANVRVAYFVISHDGAPLWVLE